MSGDIFINYAGVNTVLEDLQGVIQQIGTQLDNLDQEIQPLRATWAGVSEDEYIKVQARWNADMQDMSQVLVQAAGTLDTMSGNTARTDNTVAAGWQSIT